MYLGRPTILCYEPSKAVTPGSLVSFLCKVQAYPGPVSISWNGSRERTDVSNVGIQNMLYAFKVIVNAWNSTLSFKDFVEVDDSGLYTITARNVHGETSATVELQVLREFTGHAHIHTYNTYVHMYIPYLHTYVSPDTYCTNLAFYIVLLCTINDYTYFILGMNFANSMYFTKYEHQL